MSPSRGTLEMVSSRFPVKTALNRVPSKLRHGRKRQAGPAILVLGLKNGASLLDGCLPFA